MSSGLEKYRLSVPIPEIFLIPEFISEAEETYLSRKIDEVGNSNAVVQPDGTISIRAGGWQTVAARRSMQWGGTISPRGKLLPQPLPSFMDHEWPNVFERLEQLEIFKPQDSFSKQAGPSKLSPNHCLVNEYLPGHGILPHEDGPAYVPTVATLSLDSDTVYEFHCYSDDYISFSNKLSAPDRPQRGGIPSFALDEPSEPLEEGASPRRGRSIAPDPLFSIFVPRRSLIVISSDCYKLLHSIPGRTSDDLSQHLTPCINWSNFDVLEHNLVQGQLSRERRLSLTCRRVQKVLRGLNRFGK